MQRSKKIVTITLLSCFLVSATALAQTLQQKSQHKYSEDMLNGQLKDTNTDCGASIAGQFDWTGFDKLTPTDSSGNLGFQPGQFARECLQGVDQVCKRNPTDGKAAIKTKVQKVVIAYGGEGKRSVALAGGTFTYTIDPKKGVSDETCREYLMQHL